MDDRVANRCGAAEERDRVHRLSDTDLILAMRQDMPFAFVEFIDRFRHVAWNEARGLGVDAGVRKSWTEEVLHNCVLALTRNGSVTPANIAGYIIVAVRRQFVADKRKLLSEDALLAAYGEELHGSENDDYVRLPEPLLKLAENLASQIGEDDEALLEWRRRKLGYSQAAAWLGVKRDTVAHRALRLKTRLQRAALKFLESLSDDGRRVFTRTRRDQTSPHDATVSGPLCMALIAPTCRSFTERVWWDGDQSLVEKRTPEGTSDASNNGTVGNINALTLDEPLAVNTTTPTTQTRIINYNWRGQGMSSVFPDGSGADYVTGSTSAEIDWPSFTQAETYFTPNLDGQEQNYSAKKWLGTFVQGGQGTTAMLYRRNRYFDTKTGRFTQEDPIGIAGGVNQYGFAAGDPVNYIDPFGLCPMCVVAVAWGAYEIGSAAYDLYTAARTVFSNASGAEKGMALGFAALSVFGPGGGYSAMGKAAEKAIVGDLIRDATDNPRNWKAIGSFTEEALNKKAKGGISIQTIIENPRGDRLVRHTIRDREGKVIEDHYRPAYKARKDEGR